MSRSSREILQLLIVAFYAPEDMLAGQVGRGAQNDIMLNVRHDLASLSRQAHEHESRSRNGSFGGFENVCLLLSGVHAKAEDQVQFVPYRFADKVTSFLAFLA